MTRVMLKTADPMTPLIPMSSCKKQKMGVYRVSHGKSVMLRTAEPMTPLTPMSSCKKEKNIGFYRVSDGKVCKVVDWLE